MKSSSLKKLVQSVLKRLCSRSEKVLNSQPASSSSSSGKHNSHFFSSPLRLEERRRRFERLRRLGWRVSGWVAWVGGGTNGPGEAGRKEGIEWMAQRGGKRRRRRRRRDLPCKNFTADGGRRKEGIQRMMAIPPSSFSSGLKTSFLLSPSTPTE